jgi:hypothetical protein
MMLSEEAYGAREFGAGLIRFYYQLRLEAAESGHNTARYTPSTVSAAM